MITYLFPPMGGSGSLRPLKLAKHLPLFGWRPVILTIKNPDWYYAWDPEPLTELSADIIVVRSLMFRSAWFYRLLNPLRIKKLDKIIKQFLIHPDEQIGWIPFAYWAGIRMIRKFNIQAMYSTSGPLSCHLIGYLIRKRIDIPWIAEFRDEWFEAPNLQMPTRFHRNFHHQLEGKIVTTADKIVTMAPAFNRLLRKHCDNSDKFVTITGGFDKEDFRAQISRKTQTTDPGLFRLVFTGLVYDTFRPVSLIKAITELIKEGKVSQKEVKIQFVGNSGTNSFDYKDEYGICEFIKYQPRKEALIFVRNANVLLLLLSNERGAGVIPSKTFEYMASGKPILALVPLQGEVAHIIKRTNTGVVVDFEDIEGIKDAYLRFYQMWKKNRHVSIEPDGDKVKKFNQKYLTKKLADLLQDGLR